MKKKVTLLLCIVMKTDQYCMRDYIRDEMITKSESRDKIMQNLSASVE